MATKEQDAVAKSIVSTRINAQEGAQLRISCDNAKWVRIDNSPMGFIIVVQFDYEKISLKAKKLKVYSEIAIKDEKGDIHLYSLPLNNVVMDKNKGTFPAVFLKGGAAEGIGTMAIYVSNGDGEIISNKISIPVAGGAKYEKEMETKFGPPRGSPRNPW
jgi:hypothetical protein